MPNNPHLPLCLYPDWPAPPGVRAAVTTRHGGVSLTPYASFNLGTHVGDDPAAVAANRARLRALLDLPADPDWLCQVHGACAVALPTAAGTCADAAYTQQPGVVCAVLTADCLPVLFCDRAGRRIAAAHAGWRGLVNGVLEATLTAAQLRPADTLAWLGPAIGPTAFEVGAEVRAAFLAQDPQAATAFVPQPNQPGHWLADLYTLARQRLANYGVSAVYGGGRCTYHEAALFYSYRRERDTGRMASLIWLTADAPDHAPQRSDLTEL